jgi:hypothetical protein
VPRDRPRAWYKLLHHAPVAAPEGESLCNRRLLRGKACRGHGARVEVASFVADVLHSSTFCVRKPNRKWRMVHAFNKLNAATIPASTPIPRKDVLQNDMAGCTVFSALAIVDAYYQLLMRESNIPLTAVSTPSGMLWEWLVMLQGFSNAPATFNRLVTQLFRPLRHFVQTYFDDIFVHSRAEDGKTDADMHLAHLRDVLMCIR